MFLLKTITAHVFDFFLLHKLQGNVLFLLHATDTMWFTRDVTLWYDNLVLDETKGKLFAVAKDVTVEDKNYVDEMWIKIKLSILHMLDRHTHTIKHYNFDMLLQMVVIHTKVLLL